ncbi:glycosyltransferase family 2 protein [Clostridium beijerinckii]|uniref:glycosyltransferase family 2 protein n=1 Tax=Clostridium beijerinckii TaxID=1520 RepID=UPI00232A7EC4|nr:glycosyltransferase family 2 protein [Clostridium beijerinckii]
MTENEYIEKINRLLSCVTSENAEEISNELNYIYDIKPVRLIWFVAKAKANLYLNLDKKQIVSLVAGKSSTLFNYNGIDEYNNFLEEVSRWNDDFYETLRIRYRKCKINRDLTLKERNEFIKVIYDKIISYSNEFLEESSFQKWIRQFTMFYLTAENYTVFYIMALYCNAFNEKGCMRKFVESMPNMGYIKTLIEGKTSDTFILVATNENNKMECLVLQKVLSHFNKRVILLDVPIRSDVNSKIQIADTLEISLGNIEEFSDYTLIHPIEIIHNNSSLGDNREYIIDYICKELAENNLATVLCNGSLMDELCMRPLMKKQMERLSNFSADYLEDNMAFGWVGNYTSYISKIYDFDVEAEINKPAEYNFSIVIPARNSADSLKYTLKTCLNQRYEGSFEIVLSDNSTNGNTEVYDLYCELNDPRIKYYKTPRDLHLPKSFEFAFLKAKGDFIVSIGSDDALLPWTLEILSDVIDKYPEEEIFQWERGFYAWPGFNGGQENQFTIPSKYEKNNYEIYNVSKNSYLAMILNDPQCMYALPLLYINSGFRRSYFITLLHKTGRLWDGICQDLYIGVINISINNHITNIKYPLTIAGMTGASIGAKSNSGAISVLESNKRVDENKRTNNIGGFSTSFIERLMPEVTTDISSLYNSILRAVARGVLPIDFLDNLLNWKKMFEECFMQLDIRDVLFDKKLHYFRYTASKHGDEFLKWFDENIYEKAIIPREIDDKINEEILKRKTYVEGPIETGGQILDASRYGVTNVYEASLLFEKITKL